jgi:hypothetical protein
MLSFRYFFLDVRAGMGLYGTAVLLSPHNSEGQKWFWRRDLGGMNQEDLLFAAIGQCPTRY